MKRGSTINLLITGALITANVACKARTDSGLKSDESSSSSASLNDIDADVAANLQERALAAELYLQDLGKKGGSNYDIAMLIKANMALEHERNRLSIVQAHVGNVLTKYWPLEWVESHVAEAASGAAGSAALLSVPAAFAAAKDWWTYDQWYGATYELFTVFESPKAYEAYKLATANALKAAKVSSQKALVQGVRIGGVIVVVAETAYIVAGVLNKRDAANAALDAQMQQERVDQALHGQAEMKARITTPELWKQYFAHFSLVLGMRGLPVGPASQIYGAYVEAAREAGVAQDKAENFLKKPSV